jgi:DNA polymerase theta
MPYLIILSKIKYLLSDTDIVVDGFIGGQSPKGGFESVDIAICTIEKSNSLLNKLIENDSIFELGNY